MEIFSKAASLAVSVYLAATIAYPIAAA